MTVVVEEKIEEPVLTLKQKFANCLKGQNLLKTLVVLVCTVVVVEQITSCVKKLINVPITTYTHFDFNKSILYPSVTFCRDPPYKYNEMLDHGLYAHPRYTSVWRNYNFSYSLDDLWNDITYSQDEVFVQYGLNGETSNVEVRPTTSFLMGRCYTLTPRQSITRAARRSGYSITLQHQRDDITTSTSVTPPGYHVYVHFHKEPFTEVEVYNGGMVDYFYLNVGEYMDVKLSVDEYKKISQEGDICNNHEDYSANYCTSKCVWDLVGKESGCSGPWMKSHLQHCRNHTDMVKLIIAYMRLHHTHNCSSCARFCNALMYKVFVNDRRKNYYWNALSSSWSFKQGGAKLQSQLYMYFNSMLVSVYEERYNYDWNHFISDLGGSVGFLLGLSVIGLLTFVTKLWCQIIHPFIKVSKVNRAASIGSCSTVRIKEDLDGNGNDVIRKCDDWHKKNTENFI